MNIDNIRSKLIEADIEYYFEDKSTITDDEYDALVDLYNSQSHIPYKPIYKTKDIAVNMGSLNKLKTTSTYICNISKKLATFVGEVDEINISCKLDGVSALYINRNGNKYLYNRTGRDITHILKHINIGEIPNKTMCRGELILPLSHYDTSRLARQAVSGLVNRMQENIDIEKLKDVHFIGYELITSKSIQLDKNRQFEILSKTMEIPLYVTVKSDMCNPVYLLDLYNRYTCITEYGMDGLVLTQVKEYDINDRYANNNPKYAIAFKLDAGVVSAVVHHVEWKTQKTGRIKPILHLLEVDMDGIVVKKVYAYNGRYIRDKKINSGSIISIVMSGDVVPKINSVIEPSETASEPENYEYFDGVDYITKPNNIEIISYFLSSTGLKGIRSKTLKNLEAYGYKSLDDYVNPTIKLEKKNQKYVDIISKHISSLSIADVAAYSCYFNPRLSKSDIKSMFTGKTSNKKISKETAGLLLNGYTSFINSNLYKKLGF